MPDGEAEPVLPAGAQARDGERTVPVASAEAEENDDADAEPDEEDSDDGFEADDE